MVGSGNPMIPDENIVELDPSEWNGLSELLRAYADGEPERATAGTDLEPDELARNYADHIDEEINVE